MPEDQWQIGGHQSPSCRVFFIRTLFQSTANLVILPIQDVCGYGRDTRMNEPGTKVNNWFFRMTRRDYLKSMLIGIITSINSINERALCHLITDDWAPLLILLISLL